MNSLTAAALQAIGPTRQEITFADGSTVWLHLQAQPAGRQQIYSRDLSLADGSFMPVDLVRVAPELRYELPAPTTRDAAAAVFHSLRKHFGSAAQFRDAVAAAAS